MSAQSGRYSRKSAAANDGTGAAPKGNHRRFPPMPSYYTSPASVCSVCQRRYSHTDTLYIVAGRAIAHMSCAAPLDTFAVQTSDTSIANVRGVRRYWRRELDRRRVECQAAWSALSAARWGYCTMTLRLANLRLAHALDNYYRCKLKCATLEVV